MATRVKPTAKNLYDADFYAWAHDQAELLRDKRFDELDLENLIEEVEDLAGALKALDASSRHDDHRPPAQAAALAGRTSPAWPGVRPSGRSARELLNELTPSLRRHLADQLARTLRPRPARCRGLAARPRRAGRRRGVARDVPLHARSDHRGLAAVNRRVRARRARNDRTDRLRRAGPDGRADEQAAARGGAPAGRARPARGGDGRAGRRRRRGGRIAGRGGGPRRDRARQPADAGGGARGRARAGRPDPRRRDPDLRRSLDHRQAVAVEVAAALAGRGIATLDAPVSGGVRGATQGTLAVMVAGRRPSSSACGRCSRCSAACSTSASSRASAS